MASKNPYDMTPEEQEALTKENAGKALEGLEAQVGAKKSAIDNLATTQAGERGVLAQRMGQASNLNRMRGGGGGDSGSLQTAANSAIASTQQAGQFADQRSQAETDLAKAQTDFATESEKMNKAAEAYRGAEDDAYQDGVALFQAYDALIMTDEDRANVIADLESKRDNASNSNAKAGYQRAIDDIKSGKLNKSGALDTNTGEDDVATWVLGGPIVGGAKAVYDFFF